MVMFPAHILTVAMRTSSWGTEEEERWEAQRDVQSDVFQQEWIWERRHRGRGDERGMKRERRTTRHSSTHLQVKTKGDM